MADEWSIVSPRGQSYLWKTTHLNTEEKQEEGKEGGKKKRREKGERKDEGKRRGKRRETVVECEKQQQVLLPPTSSNPAATSLRHCVTWTCTSCPTLTFALSRAKTATFVSAGGGSLVEGRGLCVALAAGNLTVNLIGQIPQETDAVLDQLQEGTRWSKGGVRQRNVSWLKKRTKYSETSTEQWTVTLLSTSLRLICDWTTYISESTNPVHSLSFRRASLRSELTFLLKRGDI